LGYDWKHRLALAQPRFVCSQQQSPQMHLKEG